MTIRDMIDAGITFEGHIRVKAFYDNYNNEEILYEQEDLFGNEPWMDKEVTYIYPYSDTSIGLFGSRIEHHGVCIEIRGDED